MNTYTLTKEDIAFAKALARYRNKWVALQDRRVVASGGSVQEVQKKAERKGIKNYAFHFVSSKRLAMVV